MSDPASMIRRPSPLVLQTRARKRAALFGRQKPRDLLDWMSMFWHMGAGLDQLVFKSRQGRFESHVADLFIAGANPVLNLLSALSAARHGLSAVVTQVDVKDDWAYGLLDHPPFLYFLFAASGARDREAAPTLLPADVEALLERGVGRSDLDAVGVLSQITDMALGARRAELLRTDSFAPGLCLGPPEDEIAVYLRDPDGKAELPGPLQAAAGQALRQELFARLPRLVYGPGPNAMRLVFARKVVLTSALSGFMEYGFVEGPDGEEASSAPQPLVQLLGTARRRLTARDGLIRQAVDDVFGALGSGSTLSASGAEPPAQALAG